MPGQRQTRCSFVLEVHLLKRFLICILNFLRSAAQGSNLYGLQLVFQLFVAHLLSLGSTISIIVTTLPEEGHPKQVVAMASLQLKSAGPELVKAISCKRGAPVVSSLVAL
eukprot:620681-Pelagomonas_calceolata.AAC.2